MVVMKKKAKDDDILPSTLRSDAREREKANVISSIRKERDAELAALGQKKVSALQEKLFKGEDRNAPNASINHVAPAVVKSKVASMRENISKKKDEVMPTSLEGFYENQRASNVGDKQQKAQAKDSLRNFREKSDKGEYRAFIFAVHEDLGMLLLQCTKKKKKGPHYQLPGGHVDKSDFDAVAQYCEGDKKKELLAASKVAAARELYEETEIDIRNDLDRLQPALLRQENDTDKNQFICEHQKRFYFFLWLTGDDFVMKAHKKKKEESSEKTDKQGYVTPIGQYGHHLMLKLSDEHSGFTFEKEMKVAANLINKHSGGVNKEALVMIMQQQQNAEIKWIDFFDRLEEINKLNDDIKIDFNRNQNNDIEEQKEPEKKRGLFSCFFCWGKDSD